MPFFYAMNYIWLIEKDKLMKQLVHKCVMIHMIQYLVCRRNHQLAPEEAISQRDTRVHISLFSVSLSWCFWRRYHRPSFSIKRLTEYKQCLVQGFFVFVFFPPYSLLISHFFTAVQDHLLLLLYKKIWYVYSGWQYYFWTENKQC